MYLYQFSISHFCEKAKWALDYKQLPFSLVTLIPQMHVKTAKKLGLKSTQVPILQDEGNIIQCSDAIIDYIEEKHSEHSLSVQQSLSDEARSLETQISDDIGVPLRALLYPIALQDKKLLIHLMSYGGPFYAKAFLNLFFPKVKSFIQRKYGAEDKQRKELTDNIHRTLDALEVRLEKQPWLCGEHFSRVDISLAALLSPLIQPKEHPFPWADTWPDDFYSFREPFQDRPIYKWVLETYKTHRWIAESP